MARINPIKCSKFSFPIRFLDGSLETQEYRKTVKLPESVDPELITSFLSQDGVLTIECVIAIEKEKPKLDLSNEGPITEDADGNQVGK